MCMHLKTVSKYMSQNLLELKGNIAKSTSMVGDYNTSFCNCYIKQTENQQEYSWLE